MKKTKKILSVILTLVMTLTAIPVFTLNVAARPSTSSVVYLKTGGTGTGASPESPIGSLASAVGNIAGAGGGTIVLVGPTELTGNIIIGNASSDVTVKITSLYDGVDYRETAKAALVFTRSWINVSAKNNFEYENITFLMNGNNCSFFGNGYQLTFGKGVKTEIQEGQDAKNPLNYPNIYGGSAYDLSGTKNFPANTSVTVLSGTFRRIIAGGLGNAANPRPSMSASLAISSEVKSLAEHGFELNENGAVDGEKILIYIGEKNADFDIVATAATRTASITGNGYIQGTAPGSYNLWADSGYGAKIGDEIFTNGEYKNDEKTLSVTFVESDINKAAELEASRPILPSAFPGEYIKGYDNGDGTMSFRPSGNITIAESATILVRLLTTEEKIKDKYTTDKAKNTDWYYNNIAYLDHFESFDGFDNFDPNRQITRGEFVKLITIFKKLISKTDEIKFTDVDASHKYYEAVKAGTMARLVNGYDNGDGTFSFKPDAPITRAEVVTVINRVFDMADLAPIKYKNMVPNFSDVDGEHWAAFQIVAAAGGKLKEKEKADITGSGEVEFEVAGNVIYVRGDAPDGGDGSSYDKAIKWGSGGLAIAEGGTVVICGPVEFNSNFRFTSGHTGTVLFTSVYGGVDYRETKNAAIIFGSNWRNGIPGGDMIFDNIAFISRGNNCSIYCDNQDVTFGKDVVCAVETGAPIALYAGSANDLSACVNYIGSTSKSKAHTGDYFGDLTINGGSWGNVTAGGKGNNEKPRESEAAVISVSENAKVGFISGGSKTDKAKVHGMRVIILNNYEKAIIENENYEYIVVVNADAEAEAISISKDSVTVKITAKDGSKVEGAAEDGTVVLTGEGSLTVISTANGIKVVKGTKSDVGKLGDEKVEYATSEYLAELDAMEEKRRNEIFSTISTVKPKEGATAYYVSTSGDDANDGKSPEKPWKTIEKLNKAELKKGDVVYFKRGDEWRNVALSAKAGVTYSAYGEGAKPILNRSPFDGAKHGEWIPVAGMENIYRYSEKFVNDIGTISFNNRTYRDIYAQKVCFAFNADKKPTVDGVIVENPLTHLKNDLDFWHDLKGPNTVNANGGELYMRSNGGNPAERFDNIEFNQRGNAISIAGNNVTIDNITIRHAGSHGIGAGTVAGLNVTNCVLEWIGGSMQNYSNDFVRFGNAVEVYGGCDGYLVDNCYIDQVYDAGVTHQVSNTSAGDYIMKNVTYSNNVILNCIYSIEHFNRANPGTTRYLANISYKNNLCRYAGYGFGITRPNKGAASHIRSGTIVDTANFVIENNVFDRSVDNLFLLTAGGDEQIQWKNNVYIHRLGAKYGTMKSVSVVYNSFIEEQVEKHFAHKEIGGRYLFVEDK